MWLRSAKFILVPMVTLLISYAACAEHEAAPRPLPTGPPIVVVEFRSELLWAPRFLLYRAGTAIGTTARDVQAAIKTHTPLTMRHARLTDRERDDLVRAVQNVLQNGGTTRYRVERASDIPHYVLSADAPGTIEVSGRIEGLRGWLNRRALPPQCSSVVRDGTWHGVGPSTLAGRATRRSAEAVDSKEASAGMQHRANVSVHHKVRPGTGHRYGRGRKRPVPLVR